MGRLTLWGVVTLLVSLTTVFGPAVAPLAGDGHATVAFAYAGGGPGGLGYDYLGRPVLPQLLAGGATLLLAAAAAAVLSQAMGLAVGLWLACRGRGTRLVSFVLDVALVVPMLVGSLIAFTVAGSSLLATIPIVTVLTLPFTSRYYRAAAQPLLRASFVEQARAAGDSTLTALVREVLPVLLRPVLTDLGLALIAAIYLLATVSFLGTSTIDAGFMWPSMVAHNLEGLELNPWATLAPLLAVVGLTVPLNLVVDALGGRDG